MAKILLEEKRLEELVEGITRMCAGNFSERLPLSENEDSLDALVHGINSLAEELMYAHRLLKKGRDAATRAYQVKSLFLANMSHEIRTPLTGILGFTELITGELPPELRADYVRRIRQNCGSLKDLIDGILDLSKADSGTLTLQSLPLELRPSIEEWVQTLQMAAQKKEVLIQIHWGDSLPKTIVSDPLRVWQVLTNLVGNSIKFCRPGGIIKVHVKYTSGRLIIDVQDNGMGVTAQLQKQLFVPFAQGDEISRVGGVGLGLALSRSICRALKGDLTLLESIPGHSTVFRASIPVTVAQPLPLAVTAETGAQHLNGIRVLLVEDVEDIQLLFIAILNQAGAAVTLATNGLEALNFVHGSFDVILMDLSMPSLDGIEATRRMRERGCSIPIIALTAHALEDEREHCLKSGFNDYVSKPVQRTELIRCIAAHVISQETNTELRAHV